MDAYFYEFYGNILTVYGYLSITVLMLLTPVSLWFIFEKAGERGWKILIPIYNVYIYLKICGHPGWWIILLLVPGINFGIFLISCISLSKLFDKNIYFAISMFLVPWVFFPVLAFGHTEK